MFVLRHAPFLALYRFQTLIRWYLVIRPKTVPMMMSRPIAHHRNDPRWKHVLAAAWSRGTGLPPRTRAAS